MNHDQQHRYKQKCQATLLGEAAGSTHISAEPSSQTIDQQLSLSTRSSPVEPSPKEGINNTTPEPIQDKKRNALPLDIETDIPFSYLRKKIATELNLEVKKELEILLQNLERRVRR